MEQFNGIVELPDDGTAVGRNDGTVEGQYEGLNISVLRWDRPFWVLNNDVEVNV
jgi:hypothetical protein